MSKKFYQYHESRPVLFAAGVKHRSMAYGEDVHQELLEWRRLYMREWNRTDTDYSFFECGDPGGNPAKDNTRGSLRAGDLSRVRSLTPCPKKLHPLWLDGMLLDVTEDGVITVNRKPTNVHLGSGLKAWGISVIHGSNRDIYHLFVIGKPMHKEGSYLTVYPITKAGAVDEPIISMPTETSFQSKSHLYCMGRHIFMIHNSELEYFYFRPELGVLENVVLDTDEPNKGKPCCSRVIPPLVLDERGRVFWRCGNSVHSFTIGYPGDVLTLEGGEFREIYRIQCYGGRLFVYSHNKISREYECVSYDFDHNGYVDSALFNRNAIYNVFYKSINGVLHYVRIPYEARSGALTLNNNGTEEYLGELNLNGCYDMFCTDGCLYAGVDYVSLK